uniref:Uncharacterized protein n=1 Tax=Glossina austeni TaxID=7395 RepID=A0A1A9V306_GLOAU
MVQFTNVTASFSLVHICEYNHDHHHQKKSSQCCALQTVKQTQYSLVNVMPRFASTRNERKVNLESIEDINLKLLAIINRGPDEVHCKCRRGSSKNTPALTKQDPEEVRKENFVQILYKCTGGSL